MVYIQLIAFANPNTTNTAFMPFLTYSIDVCTYMLALMIAHITPESLYKLTLISESLAPSVVRTRYPSFGKVYILSDGIDIPPVILGVFTLLDNSSKLLFSGARKEGGIQEKSKSCTGAQKL